MSKPVATLAHLARKTPIAALVLTAMSVPATAAWIVKGRGENVYAEVRSQARGGLLRFSCEDTVKLYVYPPRAWDGYTYDKATLAIDGAEIKMVVDPADKAVIFSDLPNESVGVTADLRMKMKGGTTLVIAGPPTAKIRPDQLTFPLGGAADAVTAFERQCPSARQR